MSAQERIVKDHPLVLLGERQLTPEEVHFQVIRSSNRIVRTLIWMINVIIVVFLNYAAFILLPGIALLITIIVIFVSVYVWKKFGSKAVNYFIVKNLESIESPITPVTKFDKIKYYIDKAIKILMGLDLKQANDYYMEGQIFDLQLSGRKGLNPLNVRLLDILSACTGMAFLIASTLGRSNVAATLVLFTIIIFISPVLVFWLIPVLWTLEDSGIRVVNPKLHIDTLANNMRRSFVSRFLGLAGVLTVFGYLTTSDEVWDLITQGEKLNLIDKYLLSLLFTVVVLLMISGTAYGTALVYLYYYHEKFVNDTRTKLLTVIPIVHTTIRKLQHDELLLVKQEYTNSTLKGYEKWEEMYNSKTENLEVLETQEETEITVNTDETENI